MYMFQTSFWRPRVSTGQVPISEPPLLEEENHWTQWEINKEPQAIHLPQATQFLRLQIGEAETHANLLEYVVQIWEFP